MRTSGVDFLSIVSDDNGPDDLTSTDSLSLDSFSQSVVPQSSISELCRFSNRALKKMNFLGKSSLLLTILSNFIGSASAEMISNEKWKLLKSYVCAMIFTELKANETFLPFQDKPNGHYYRVDSRSSIRSILGDWKLFSRDSLDNDQVDVVLLQLSNRAHWLSGEFSSKVHRSSYEFSTKLDSSIYHNVDRWLHLHAIDTTDHCPSLYNYINDTIPVVPTSSPTAVITDHAKDIVAIFMLTMLVFALMFFLVSGKCSRLKNMGFAMCKRAILGKERVGRENDVVLGPELEEVVCRSAALSDDVHKRGTGKGDVVSRIV